MTPVGSPLPSPRNSPRNSPRSQSLSVPTVVFQNKLGAKNGSLLSVAAASAPFSPSSRASKGAGENSVGSRRDPHVGSVLDKVGRIESNSPKKQTAPEQDTTIASTTRGDLTPAGAKTVPIEKGDKNDARGDTSR